MFGHCADSQTVCNPSPRASFFRLWKFSPTGALARSQEGLGARDGASSICTSWEEADIPTFNSNKPGHARRHGIECDGLSLPRLHFHLQLIFVVRLDPHFRPIPEITLEHRGVGPFQVPPVRDSHGCIFSRQHLAQREGSVAVALIAPEEDQVMSWVTRDENDRSLTDGLAVPQRDTVDRADALGHGDRQADGCARRYLQLPSN